jgi:hypothetical protein
MRKVSVAIAGALVLLIVGILAWNAEATPLTGATPLHSAADSSLAEKIACRRQTPFSRCPLGQHWQAGSCVPCPGFLACPCAPGYCSCTKWGVRYVCCDRIVNGRRCC